MVKCFDWGSEWRRTLYIISGIALKNPVCSSEISNCCLILLELEVCGVESDCCWVVELSSILSWANKSCVTKWQQVKLLKKIIHHVLRYTRIMVSKGMVSKSKYWILEKNKGIPVSIFTESVLTFFQLCFIRVWSLRASTGFPKK